MSETIDAVAGRAEPEATKRFADEAVARGHAAVESYALVDGLSASSIGLGTYLGDADDVTDVLYVEAIVEAVGLGCNVVDSAINYRFQRSERAVGEAVRRLVAAGVDRASLVVATKGGYVPFDGEAPRGPGAVADFVRRTYIEAGIAEAHDFVSRGQHSMAPRYLAHEIDVSRRNLGLETIDVYYVHNPEGQLPEVGRDEFERRIRAAFEMLESKVADGALARYGVATWNGFRQDPDDASYLSLERLAAIASDVGGSGHHFRVVQLPYNLYMTEAFGHFNQSVEGEDLPLLEAAERLGISVFASASLLQSRLAGALPDEVKGLVRNGTAAQLALQFSRSTPGVASALVGMSRVAHVRENLALLASPPASLSTIRELFEEQ
jgi:aryl-alcohol dehydrogenase-like predicted oxidoreductase